ncbi:MAG TPA: hypothetical protein VGJ33_15200 [Candidatus Angelobacter sp.]
MSYIYNLDGSLKTLTYPSNATITYAPCGKPERLPSAYQDRPWAQGHEMKLGPFTAGASDRKADIHKGDTIYVFIDQGP